MPTVNRYLGVNSDGTDVNNWSQSTAPATNELLVFPRFATAKALSTNIDYSAKDFAGINTEPGCNVTIGGSSNPLKCACSGATAPGKIIHNGDAAFYLKAEHATLDIKEIEVNSNNMTLAMEIDDDATAQALLLRVLKGKVNTAQGITALPHVEVGSRHNPDSDAVVLLDTHASNVVARLLINAGVVTAKKEITLAIVAGGLLITSGTEPLVTLYGCGGRIEHNSTGTITLAAILAGALDFTKNEGKAVTLTTAYGLRPGQIFRHDGVTIVNDETQPDVLSYDLSEGFAL